MFSSFCISRNSYYCLLLISVIGVNFCNVSLAYLKVIAPLSPVTEADLGSQLLLSCNVSGEPPPYFIWLKEGRSLPMNLSWEPPYNDRQVLISYSVLSIDAGNYTCLSSNLYDFKKQNTQLRIKTPPGKLQNVSVHPSTVVATVRWHVDNDGGYPITNFTLLYRPTNASSSEKWHVPQPVHVSPSARQFFIYQLKPGTDYTFRMWATNKLGPGEPVSVRASTAKPIEPPEVLEKMLEDAEDFSSTAWLVAICMVAATVLTLSFLSCALIYREHRNETPEESLPRIIANPGFEIDLEQSYLLDHADYNDNTERTVRINNNTVIQPSRV
ncbi:protein turtle homolog A-like [Stegodyphus dumicola]|uniref:protein turtle homolog A-like n=1 Tax=Stegodyphus dumicola TaxID=202533 RepID=UPI0015AB88F8|nr:protein turtle homolog A-like [Stegodyphus dumicola]